MVPSPVGLVWTVIFAVAAIWGLQTGDAWLTFFGCLWALGAVTGIIGLSLVNAEKNTIMKKSYKELVGDKKD